MRKQLVSERGLSVQLVTEKDHESECIPPWNEVEEHSTRGSLPNLWVFERKGRYLIQIGERDGASLTGFGLIIDPR